MATVNIMADDLRTLLPEEVSVIHTVRGSGTVIHSHEVDAPKRGY